MPQNVYLVEWLSTGCCMTEAIIQIVTETLLFEEYSDDDVRSCVLIQLQMISWNHAVGCYSSI